MGWEIARYSRNIKHWFRIASTIGTNNLRYIVKGPQYVGQTGMSHIRVGADRRHHLTASLSGWQNITAQSQPAVTAFMEGKILVWDLCSLPRVGRDKFLHLRLELDPAKEEKIVKIFRLSPTWAPHWHNSLDFDRSALIYTHPARSIRTNTGCNKYVFLTP